MSFYLGDSLEIRDKISYRKSMVDHISHLKTLQWQKLPDFWIAKNNTIWNRVQKSKFVLSELECKTIDQFFSLKKFSHNITNNKIHENNHIPVDRKKIFSLSILLKQWRLGAQVIYDEIYNLECKRIDLEKLKLIEQYLPTTYEDEKLKSENYNLSDLSDAELFYVIIVQIKEYRIRIRGMIFFEEFKPTYYDTLNKIYDLVNVYESLIESTVLIHTFAIILECGNRMNKGHPRGLAYGFLIDSIQIIADTKSNEPGIKILNIVVKFLFQHNLWNDMSSLIDKFSQIKIINSKEMIKEIASLKSYYSLLKNHIEYSPIEVFQAFKPLIDSTNDQIEFIDKLEKALEEKSKDLMSYFCVEPKLGNIENLIHSISYLFSQIKTAFKQNDLLEKQEIVKFYRFNSFFSSIDRLNRSTDERISCLSDNTRGKKSLFTKFKSQLNSSIKKNTNKS